jgi:hypothetical protein
MEKPLHCTGHGVISGSSSSRTRHSATRMSGPVHRPMIACANSTVSEAAIRRDAGGKNLITIWDFTGRRDSSGNQRESATVCPWYPQDLSLIPAGLSLYSRSAVLLFPLRIPQRCPFIPGPAALAQQPRAAFSSRPACADGGDGRDPYRQACGPAKIVRLLRSAVARAGRSGPPRRACKLRGSPRPGPQLEQGTLPDEPEEQDISLTDYSS